MTNDALDLARDSGKAPEAHGHELVPMLKALISAGVAVEGRVVGQNVIAGDTAVFPGTVEAGVCKVLGYTARATGLSERSARNAGLDPVCVVHASRDRPMFGDP